MTHRSGSAIVRRDFMVFVSPPARTERHTSTKGGIGGVMSDRPLGEHAPTAAHATPRCVLQSAGHNDVRMHPG